MIRGKICLTKSKCSFPRYDRHTGEENPETIANTIGKGLFGRFVCGLVHILLIVYACHLYYEDYL
jgi:hypothetical protein